MNWELPDVQAGFRKGRGTSDQVANIYWITEKAREFQKNTSASLTTLKPLIVWITINCGKFSSSHRTGKVFIPIPKKGSAKECSNYCATALISHARKVILKILQARLQQYVNQEIPDIPAGFQKGRGTKDQIANICWITEKAREFQKNIYFCFIDYTKSFYYVDHSELWKILRGGNTRPPYLPPE